MPILVGTDGVRRMGKSLGNYVGVGDSANDQFGKTMSIPDTLMRQWFELLTDRPGDGRGGRYDDGYDPPGWTAAQLHDAPGRGLRARGRGARRP